WTRRSSGIWPCLSLLALRDGRRRLDLGPGCHDLRRRLDRLHDVVVTGTAADIPFQTDADFALGRVGIALEQLPRRHDHPRGAEAALETVLIPERLLQRVERRALRQALDGGDLGAVGLDRKHRAGLGAVTVELDR